ncbi:hypothetical protein LTR85_000121 [Meristemomyces frigidus]|nr:hypothetical protein LTR85_000121 [Meristemomyces frigidus]
MAPSILLKLLLLAAAALMPVVHAQSNQLLNFVFTSNDFNSFDADGDPAPSDSIERRGGVNATVLGKRDTAFGTGFSIIDQDGGIVYNAANPGGYSPCFNTGGGRTFTVSGGCFSGSYQFHCESNFDGTPNSCAAEDTSGAVLGSGEGNTGMLTSTKNDP